MQQSALVPPLLIPRFCCPGTPPMDIPFINRLPPELLVAITTFITDQNTIFQLATVCRHWHDTLTGTATLWTSIDCRSRSRTSILLQRIQVQSYRCYRRSGSLCARGGPHHRQPYPQNEVDPYNLIFSRTRRPSVSPRWTGPHTQRNVDRQMGSPPRPVPPPLHFVLPGSIPCPKDFGSFGPPLRFRSVRIDGDQRFDKAHPPKRSVSSPSRPPVLFETL